MIKIGRAVGTFGRNMVKISSLLVPNFYNLLKGFHCIDSTLSLGPDRDFRHKKGEGIRTGSRGRDDRFPTRSRRTYFPSETISPFYLSSYKRPKRDYYTHKVPGQSPLVDKDVRPGSSLGRVVT